MLFLDEPTTGLDPRSRNEIWSVVRELVRDGTTLLLTTQYLEEADQLAERIAVIDHGRVIAEGTGSELKDRVGGQILEVELTSAAERDRARAALVGVGCGEPEPGERLAQLTLPAPRDGLEMIEDAASALRNAEIAVSDLGLRRPTLDDVFLQLTARLRARTGRAPKPRAATGCQARRASAFPLTKLLRSAVRPRGDRGDHVCHCESFAPTSPTRKWSACATCATSYANQICSSSRRSSRSCSCSCSRTCSAGRSSTHSPTASATSTTCCPASSSNR